ncbi:DUF1217 domain-containing protein [Sulfitobacter sp. LCG007]
MFRPVVPSGGIAGWRFLERTYASQTAAFNKSPSVTRSTDYFRQNIGKIASAEQLVKDRRMLEVALGAFGLQDDIDNRYFIRKMLEEGSKNDDALSNKLSDDRYKAFVKAFGFGPGEVLQVNRPGFADGIVANFLANSFEVAMGEQDETMRIALYAQRTLSDTISAKSSNDAKWFSVMGQPPLRSLFETALNLPKAFGQIDIDQQLSVFKERATKVFGSAELTQFNDPKAIDDLVTKYIARSQIASLGSGASSNSIALTILQS